MLSAPLAKVSEWMQWDSKSHDLLAGTTVNSIVIALDRLHYGGHHITHRLSESLCCTPESQATLCVNYVSINQSTPWTSDCPWLCCHKFYVVTGDSRNHQFHWTVFRKPSVRQKSVLHWINIAYNGIKRTGFRSEIQWILVAFSTLFISFRQHPKFPLGPTLPCCW